MAGGNIENNRLKSEKLKTERRELGERKAATQTEFASDGAGYSQTPELE